MHGGQGARAPKMANWKKGFGEVRLETPRAAKRTVSACLIVRNEEAKLGRCLTSLMGAVDEIVVVDTGSTDRTVEVARKYGARIGHFAWVDDYAAARNAALDLATGDWVLSIDADEWLANDASRAFIRLEAARAGNVAFAQRVRLTSGFEYWGNTRLFPRIGSRWEYRVHEQVRLPREDTMGIFDGNFLFLHDGYDEEAPPEKTERKLALLRAMRGEAAPGSRADRHARILLARALKEPMGAEALAEMEEALKAAIGFEEASAQFLTSRLYQHWLETGEFDEIDRVNEMAWQKGARGPLIHYARAVLRYEEGKKVEARKALDEAERVVDLVNVRKAFPSLFVDLRKMIDAMA